MQEQKELVSEILDLKQRMCQEKTSDVHLALSKVQINMALNEENQRLHAELEEYRQKYADEVQKRIELERIIEQMKEA